MFNTNNYKHNSQDLYRECLNFMVSKGFYLGDEFIPDGSIHRFNKDNLNGKQDEWYVAFEGVNEKGNYYLICIFNSWKMKEDGNHIYRSWDNKAFSVEDKKDFELTLDRRSKELEKTLEIKHVTIAIEADKEWRKLSINSPSEEYESYLKIKNINPIGVRFGLNKNGYPSLVIPFVSIEGMKIRTLQFISYDEQNKKSYKTFLAGGQKKGNFAVIPMECNWGKNDFYICEGYATGVSIFMALGQDSNIPIIVAGDAGNIPKVVEKIRGKFPLNKIIIAADNDNKGLNKANEAAKLYNCKVVSPKFPEERSISLDDKKYTDFNDLHSICGLDEVRKQLEQRQIKDEEKKNIDSEPCSYFNLDDYPEVIAEYVRSICITTSADPIMVMSSVLTTISAFIGKRFFISGDGRDYFQDLYPNIWISLIANSGQFKSTALNKGAKIALKQSSEVSKEVKLLKKDMNLSQDLNEKAEIQERIKEISLSNPIFPTKVTVEGFLEILDSGRCGMIISNELSAWLQNLDKKYNNDFKAILTDFFDVFGSFEYKTRTRGDIIVERPFISICGVSPATGIKSNLNLNDVASGFFARFLIITPSNKNEIPPALPNKDVFFNVEAEEKLKDILLPLLDLDENSKKYVLDTDAKEYFELIHKKVYQEKERHDDRCQEILEPFAKRWSPYILKLAMIMQYALDQSANEISVSALKSAWKFVYIAIKSTAFLYQGELGESEVQRKCRVVFKFIRKKYEETNSPVLRKTILSSKQLKGGAKEYDFVLDTLEQQGKIEVNKSEKTSEWKYIPIS